MLTDISTFVMSKIQNIISYVGIIRIRYKGLYINLYTLSPGGETPLKLPVQSEVILAQFFLFVKHFRKKSPFLHRQLL